MNIKKALSYAAFGFMFTLVNINLTLNSLTVNITPNFIGWILLFVGFDKFGKYVENKKYLKVLSLILIVLSAALWAIDLFRLDLSVTIVKVVTNVLSAIYIFGLFTILTRVAEDYHSSRADTIRYLKYINVVLFLLLSILGLVADRLSIPVLAIVFSILGILALVSAIISMIVLFRLRKEINERPAPAPEA